MIDEAKLKDTIALVLQSMKPAMAEADGEIKVGVSQRHIHLSRADLDTLFGKGYELIYRAKPRLYQQYRKRYQLSVNADVFLYLRFP